MAEGKEKKNFRYKKLREKGEGYILEVGGLSLLNGGAFRYQHQRKIQ